MHMADTFCSFTRNLIFMSCFLLSLYGRFAPLNATIITPRERAPRQNTQAKFAPAISAPATIPPTIIVPKMIINPSTIIVPARNAP